MRPNIRVQSSNRELHEAMGTRQYQDLSTLRSTLAGAKYQSSPTKWVLIALGAGIFYGCMGWALGL